MEPSATPPPDPLQSILDSAQRMGVELDRDEALRWIAAMDGESVGGVEVDIQSGVFGHRVTMADSDPAGLARLGHVIAVVNLPDSPPDVMTALALSGSAAQGRTQRFPADCDFFERVHIHAATREAAIDRLGQVVRDKALATVSGVGHRLWEVKWGSHDRGGMVRGEEVRPGHWISWTPQEVVAGTQELTLPDGTVVAIAWESAPGRPGWAKLDWVVADPSRGLLSNASNVLDPTWEAPDGEIVPLDGFLDPYFQEVYLEAESIPLFTKLVKELGADSVAEYVEQLEGEVHKYTVSTPNHGKAARRMYNVFRLTGRYAEAAYVRELFDEPVSALYQVAALLQTVADASTAGGEVFDRELLLGQVDQLIVSAIAALDGPDEAAMVDRLARFREALAEGDPDHQVLVDESRDEALEQVDAFFRRTLRAVPSISDYLDEIAARPA